MPEYRRVRIKGSTVFITLVTFNRATILNEPTAPQLLRYVWKKVAKRLPFTTNAVCVLPDHVHMLITLPENDSNYSIRIREIKRLFTRYYLNSMKETTPRNSSRIRQKEATIWQRRFWEHTIRDEQDFTNHFDYIHFNPVKHGYVRCVGEWAWSSFHSYVKQGVYDPDWGDGLVLFEQMTNFGE